MVGQESGKEAGERVYWERMRPEPTGARGTKWGQSRESRGRGDGWAWRLMGCEELRERMVPTGLTQ